MPVPVIALDELREQLERGKVTPVDGRSPREFAAGHLPDAINIQVGDATRLPELLGPDRSRVLVTYCTNEPPANAHMMLAALHIAGYTNSSMFRGGLEAWEAEGLPVERAG